MRKVGVEYDITRQLNPELSGLADTLTLKYKKKGDTNYTVGGAFTEDAEGLYISPIIYDTKSVYHIVVDSTDARVKQFAGYVSVDSFDIEDVKVAVDGVQDDVTAIKAKTDLLNTAELENLAEQITAVDTNLGNLTTLVNSEDANDGITSLREMLTEIQTGGVNVDSLINGQANIEAMLQGNEFLADGTTANPLFGKGLDEIFDAIASNLTTLNTAISNAQTAVETAITTAKESVESKVAEVKAVVDANAVTLGDATSGVVKSINDILVAIGDGGTTEIRFDAIDSAISDAQTAIMDKLTVMDAKLDTLVDRSYGGQILL